MSTNNASIEYRMKSYEAVTKSHLVRRVPVIIRLDGNAFHTFTKGMKKPFDRILKGTMQNTMKYLCENIPGCVLGYTQSDEITLVLTDYATIKTGAWFNYSIQKLCSIAASMSTLAFNKFFMETVQEKIEEYECSAAAISNDKKEWEYLIQLTKKFFKASFDARAFNIPKEEVCNNLIWRQQDATRNSIESVAQMHFSTKQLCGKNCSQLQDMLWKQFGINWNDYPADCKRGACCIKTEIAFTKASPLDPKNIVTVTRCKWVIDKEPPVFTKDREYLERFI